MDATDRHDRPRETAGTLRAHWAWYHDGAVPACSAGPERREHFERLVRPTLDEYAPPGWVGVTGAGREDSFVAMTLRDPEGVRYFTAPYAEIAAAGATYTALWLAFRGIDLPTDRERPLRVRLPGPPPAVGLHPADFEWLAGVAAAVLAGPVVITGADRLDSRARLELLDRITALLPYGCRAGLRFATSLGPTGRLRPRLAFGRVPTPGTVRVALDGVPAVPDLPAARAYLGELTMLRRRIGLDPLVAALASLREAGTPVAGDRLLGLLAEVGARFGPDAAAGGAGESGVRVGPAPGSEPGREAARFAAGEPAGPSSRAPGVEARPTSARPSSPPARPAPPPPAPPAPLSPVERLLGGDVALAAPIAERWRAEDGDEVTRHMAAALRARPASLALGWNTAVAAGRGDRLVHVLLGPVPPLLAGSTPPAGLDARALRVPEPSVNGAGKADADVVSPEALVADLCRLLGPTPTTEVPALYDALWNHPVVLRRLLDTAGADLGAWLEVIRPWDDRAPEWLAPYALLAGERLRPAEIPPAEAVFTLRVAGHTDTATIAAVLHDLWPVLVPLTEQRADPAARGLAALLEKPLGPGAPVAARVRADVLRLALGGAPTDGPYVAADLLALRHEPVAEGRFAGWIAALLRAVAVTPELLGELVRAGDPAVTAAVADAVLADARLAELPGLDDAWWAAIARARPELAGRAASGWFRNALRGVDAVAAAGVWAGEIVDGAARVRRDLYVHEVGRWWHAAPDRERDLLLPSLERELIVRGGTPAQAREELHAIRVSIAAHAWGPEAAASIVEREQEEFETFRRHLKQLRTALKHGDALRVLAIPAILALIALLAAVPPGDAAAVARSTTARTEPSDPYGAERLITALGADRERVNYVILVDTSASMQRTGRYATARSALTAFLARLSARDRVALVTFDGVATEHGNGLEPVTDPAAMAARLPPPRPSEPADGSPAGGAPPIGAEPPSDVHAALERALVVLRTSAPDSVDGVVLISDAARDAVGPDLRKDFDRLGEEGRAVSGFAVPLASDSSAGPALQRVLPNTRVLRDDPADPGVALTQARTGLYLRHAARLVDADRDKGVRATWLVPPPEQPDAVDCRAFRPVPPDRRLDLSSGREMCLRLVAGTTRVPLQVTRLRVDGVGVVGLKDGAPLLAPGQPVYFSVNLAARTHRTDGMWADAGHYDARARVVGEVHSPLAETIREQLPDARLAPRTDVAGDDLLYRGDERVDLSWWPWLLAGLGTLAVAGVAWFGWFWVRPRVRRRWVR
ncbi:VWA domain-containing protein [Embleya sp. NPDC020630]|uniref:VWA domain-containing protein n=1 Tax=Embleya sp. NPDC020630 TaxID=3363979 RepID=UPI0037A5C6ED